MKDTGGNDRKQRFEQAPSIIHRMIWGGPRARNIREARRVLALAVEDVQVVLTNIEGEAQRRKYTVDFVRSLRNYARELDASHRELRRRKQRGSRS